LNWQKYSLKEIGSVPPNTSYTTADLSYTFTDLSDNTSYTVQVFAEQSDSGLDSSMVSVIGTTGNHIPPTAPTDLSFSEITADSIRLTYGASIPDNSNGTITYYLTLLPLEATYTTTDLSYTFTDLITDTSYTVNVYGEQSDTGLDSSMVSITGTTM
jgi:hypothetical protein